MKRKSKERKKAETDLLFYLELYNELKGKEGAWQMRAWLEVEIDRIVEKLKIM